MYSEIKPPVNLSGIIDSFWMFSNISSEQFKVLPDGCIDIIFDLNQNKSIISGIMTGFQFRQLPANSNLIGIRIPVERFSGMISVPIAETRNLRVDYSQIMDNRYSFVPEQLNDFSSPNDKFLFLMSFIEKVTRQPKQSDELILSIVGLIRTLNGIINVSCLAESHNISLRQLQRRFKNAIGLTIKEFSKIVRFSHTKSLINASNKKSLLQIAFETG